MSAVNTVTFYLHPKLRRQAERGNHNFLGHVAAVLESAGLSVAYDGDDSLARLRAMARPGRGLFLMDEPVGRDDLVFRRTYSYPFWHIEKSAKRWEWPVAKEAFDADVQDHDAARRFYRFWQDRLFEGRAGRVTRGGFVYVPLQGRLMVQRSFQTCSPIEMLRAVLRHDPTRYVVATLHPSEAYSAAEKQALDRLMTEHPRLRIGTEQSEVYLQGCDYVVTQNSSAGFMGYFFEKPLILFGKIDFHHIALNVEQIGEETAFAQVGVHAPDYAAYIHWFLQLRSINAGRPEVRMRIREVLRGHGWPV
ncbi:hypothetical protein SLH49_21335 [Cognatiyoonia sp. IB215446]|uniref:capsular polysaccharide export protein, LipB/KpsS family n=1 Tax=Cognatiyoonia sp. IB215446 TaxID=3097355 RepID=UPI002A10D065|nr:hypothetical protein [Cognatiyoonia sp. IB215446]MDX8350541.1 hypothetical protein [Cognatiyoonia sp. IB215446]